jgi:hypothetical protein
MLQEPARVVSDEDTLDRDEHSMKLLEYALAIVAVGVAVLLAVVR